MLIGGAYDGLVFPGRCGDGATDKKKERKTRTQW